MNPSRCPRSRYLGVSWAFDLNFIAVQRKLYKNDIKRWKTPRSHRQVLANNPPTSNIIGAFLLPDTIWAPLHPPHPPPTPHPPPPPPPHPPTPPPPPLTHAAVNPPKPSRNYYFILVICLPSLKKTGAKLHHLMSIQATNIVNNTNIRIL